MRLVLLGIVLLFFVAFVNNPVEPYQQSDVNTVEDLGRQLFFDKVLSKDSTISCASCHNPAFAYADNRSVSLGVGDSIGERNTPSVMNMADRPYFFYDGRAESLEDQVRIPIENPLEMHMPFSDAVDRLRGDARYMDYFNTLFDTIPTEDNVSFALSEFQRNLESNGTAPHDRWMGGDSSAVTDAQHRGRELFLSDDIKCFECHFGPDFTGDEFRNIGLYDGGKLDDVGRFDITKDSSDLGKFKTPGLRNVALTAPYMHNGMFSTLEEVIDFYSNPYDFVEAPINIDTLMIEPLNLSVQQKSDLVQFLHSLTDAEIPHAIHGQN